MRFSLTTIFSSVILKTQISKGFDEEGRKRPLHRESAVGASG